MGLVFELGDNNVPRDEHVGPKGQDFALGDHKHQICEKGHSLMTLEPV